ncbi:MAG TPA: ATP-binding protein [Anaerolineales bacterium]|nr:ATP-binding protein [Anaerolineales bacterium]
MANLEKAQAYVTKSFVIDIITRDLNILDAILELVDNSFDRAVELYSIDVTKGLTEDYEYSEETNLPETLTVKIDLSKNEFVIEDNCGGIEKSDLENEVFVFGNPKKDIDQYTGLSAFGIGMKRAFFKLGRMVDLRTRTEDDEAAINWDIDEWIKLGDDEDKWGVPFANVKDVQLNYRYKMPGTIIRVKNLNKAVQTRFKQPEFFASLKKRLQTSYALFLKSGFKIILNEEELTYSIPVFYTSDELNYTSKSIKEDDVDIKIILGITPPSDREPRGWYVYCNGRMVLEADKTENTGWGLVLPLFHPKWNHFFGLVSFTSSNVKALPWSSTKWGVERDSHVYLVALEEMRLQALPILNLLDRWKGGGDDEEGAIPLRELLRGGKETSIFASAKKEQIFEYRPRKINPDVARISFSKDRKIVAKVKESLGDPKMSNSAVGELVFDYYVESEIN